MSEGESSGVLSVEKGRGVTSFQVVAHLRRVLRARRIGHGGTLDPEATGVLPILIGEATKLTPYLVEQDKEYLATVRLGLTTTTEDTTGAVLETRPVPPFGVRVIEEALGGFVGVIRQVPPMYSAVRRGGRRLYELARAGQHVEREAREVTVHAITLEAVDLPDLSIRVRCGKGTYIRTLAADLGAALSCGACLAGLIRTRVGPYALTGVVRWDDLREARHGGSLWPRLLPCDSALMAFPAVRLDAAGAARFVHGQGIVGSDASQGLVRVYGPSDLLLGVGRATGRAVKPERLLHAHPARPRVLPA
ncbi:MAG: tRNA pseudouridine(55) synthase TruB [Candidatus Rokuibacteriota bacterium]|nr:MAG: tRNA pseudouridine(55) synthase TruB [Candidatus Rokubacteria bacterium]